MSQAADKTEFFGQKSFISIPSSATLKAKKSQGGKMIKLTLLLALGVSSAFGGKVEMKPCAKGDKGGITIESVEITDCTTQPCIGIKGQNYTVSTKAKINFETKKFHVKLIGIMGSDTKKQDEIIIYEDLDVCKEFEENDKTDTTCKDIKKGKVIEKKKIWHVDTHWPTGSGTLRMIVSDDAKNEQYCGELSAKIQDKA